MSLTVLYYIEPPLQFVETDIKNAHFVLDNDEGINDVNTT